MSFSTFSYLLTFALSAMEKDQCFSGVTFLATQFCRRQKDSILCTKRLKINVYKLGTNIASLIYGKVYYTMVGVLSIIFAKRLFLVNVQLKLNGVQS